MENTTDTRKFHPFEGEVVIVDDSPATANSLLVERPSSKRGAKYEPVGVIVRVVADDAEVLTGRDQLFDTPEEADAERQRVLGEVR